MTTSQLLHPLRRLPTVPAAPSQTRRSRTVPFTSERKADPAWARPALIALLALTALAYLWDLSASGYANSFYAAAVQAGTKSWKALFFGSIDSSNFITVDKPPASLWVMALSGRIFGFSSTSMLVPQALEGVACVALLYAAVKRWFGAGAGLIAGATFALTPVAALMFRFNNPDALLVLLLVAGAYCLVRAIEQAGTRWVLAAGVMIGFAFLAKMMQAFLVLPAFALVYAVAAPTGLRRRLVQLLAGGVAVLVSAGWWVAIVALWPTGSRPLIDGSSKNSILDLITGYNGLGRIFASSAGGGGGAGAGAGANFSGATGPLRLFNSLMGGQASWLLPAALLALLAGLWARRREPRTDRVRAALLLWGGWLLVTALIFSFGQGVIHTYYTVALAPAIGALVAIGASLTWARRDALTARAMVSLAIAASAAWAYVLLSRTSSWEPWLGASILAVGALAVGALWLASTLAGRGRSLCIAAAVLGATAMIAGPSAYTLQTITTAHTGSIVSAGALAGGGGPGGGSTGDGGSPPSRAGAPGTVGASGGAPPPAGAQLPVAGGSGGGTAQAALAGGAGAPGAEGAQVSTALISALKQGAGSYRWVAAVAGSQSAAGLELASGEPVMAIGGFSNQGGNLSLAAFKRYVARGEVHYYVASAGGSRMPGAHGSSSAISAWVKAHYKASTIGGQSVYDLSKSV